MYSRTGKVQTDIITDLVMEINRAECLASHFTSEPYAHLVQVFASTYDLGQAFVLREDLLDKLDEVETQTHAITAAVMQVQDNIATLQIKTEASIKDLDDKIQKALAVNNEENYRKVAEAIRKADLPVPFDSMDEAEDYLGTSQVHRDALALAFSNSEIALSAKAKIREQGHKRFPARIVLDFLFSCEAKPSLTVRMFGPYVRAFLTDRSKWLMGREWLEQTEEHIIYKLSQHLHYNDSKVLKRRKMKRDANRGSRKGK